MDGILYKRLAIDLRMGEMLKHLKKQGVSHLGYRSIENFSVEHLSFSGRLASEMMHRFDVLSTLLLTRSAYLQCRGSLHHKSPFKASPGRRNHLLMR